MIALLIVIATFLIIAAPIVLLSGWVTMLCLGTLAHIFGFYVLAIGFWPSCLVSLILYALLGK